MTPLTLNLNLYIQTQSYSKVLNSDLFYDDTSPIGLGHPLITFTFK